MTHACSAARSWHGHMAMARQNAHATLVYGVHATVWALEAGRGMLYTCHSQMLVAAGHLICQVGSRCQHCRDALWNDICDGFAAVVEYAMHVTVTVALLDRRLKILKPFLVRLCLHAGLRLSPVCNVDLHVECCIRVIMSRS